MFACPRIIALDQWRLLLKLGYVQVYGAENEVSVQRSLPSPQSCYKSAVSHVFSFEIEFIFLHSYIPLKILFHHFSGISGMFCESSTDLSITQIIHRSL
jgi:hypothetical protein